MAKSLKSQLLCIVVGGLFVGAMAALVLAAVLITSEFGQWTKTASAHMVDAEVDNLRRLALEKAEFSSVILDSVASSTKAIARFNDRLEAGVVTGADLDLYSVLIETPTPATVPGYNAELAGHSFDVYGWWVCHPTPSFKSSCTGVSSASLLTTRTRDTLVHQRLADVLHRAQHASGITVPLGGVKGMGVEFDGGTPFYPYSQGSSYADSVVTCDRTNLAVTKTGYDPRCRPWYHGAQDLATDELFFSAPYEFAGDFPGLGVTAATPNRAAGTGDLIGVTLLDFSITKVQHTTVDAAIGAEGNGYGFVLAGDGSVVVHPSVDYSSTTAANAISNLEFGAGATGSDVDTFLQDVRDPMVAGQTGSVTYRKGGDTWYASFGPIAGTDYSLALVVPRGDVTKPADDAEDQVVQFVVIVVVVCFVLLIVVLLVAMFVATRLVDGIIRPVRSMVDTAKAINQKKFTGESAAVDTPVRELQSLQRIFRVMYEAIRVGNMSLNSGNAMGAIQVYSQSRETFSSLGYTKAVGLCDNNSGVAYTLLGDHSKAAGCFQTAVLSSEELLSCQSPTDPRYADHKAQVANRLMNLAKACVSAGSNRLPHARDALTRVQELLADQPTRSFTTLRALLLMSRVEDLEALSRHEPVAAAVMPAPFHKAVQLRRSDAHLASTVPAGVLDQLLSLAAAQHYDDAGDRPAALRQYMLTLEMGQEQDTSVVQQAQQGALKLLPAEHKNVFMRAKDVVFLLDESGSMNATLTERADGTFESRWEACSAAALSTYDTIVKPGDGFGLYSFNSQLTLHMKLQAVSPSTRRTIKSKLGNIVPSRRTLFFTSVMQCLSALQQRKSRLGAAGRQREAWVVALTDGDDNMSEASDRTVRSQLARLYSDDPTYGLIVIGLGISQPLGVVLADMAKATPMGMFFAADPNRHGALEHAFQKAAQHIASNMTVEDI